MSDLAPEVWGMPYLDYVSRDNDNNVTYEFNLAMRVSYNVARGYWDYSWYVDVDVNGQNIIDGITMKTNTAWRRIIRGQFFWMTDHNGKYRGTVKVNKNASNIVFRATFHDSNGNWSWPVYWNVPVPNSSPASGLKVYANSITPTSATVGGSIMAKGNNSYITKWRLEYGVNRYDEHTINVNNQDVMSQSWNLTDLEPDSRYQYHITVWNSSGWPTWVGGTFTTEDESMCKLVQPDETFDGRIYIIESSGIVRRVKKVELIQ